MTHPQTIPSNRTFSPAFAPQVIADVVVDFYERAREDTLLGPIFADRVSDWPAHFQTMNAFWAKALLGSQGYSGNPFEKHQPLAELTAEHFARWLELFVDAVRRHCEPADAGRWEEMARRMGYAMCMRQGLGARQELLG